MKRLFDNSNLRITLNKNFVYEFVKWNVGDKIKKSSIINKKICLLSLWKTGGGQIV